MKAQDRIDAMLDHALEMTFPASDPFSIDLAAAAARRRPPAEESRAAPAVRGTATDARVATYERDRERVAALHEGG